MGQTVSVVGNGVKNQCTLSDGTIGLITTRKPVTYATGQPVDLIFLQEDTEKGLVHLLKPEKRQAASAENQPDADSETHKPYEVVFTSEMFYVGKSEAGAYSVCPRFLQPNSTQPDLHVDCDGTIKLQEVCPYEGGWTIGCPSLKIFDQISTGESEPRTKKRKKTHSLGSVNGKLGVSKKKAKTTLVTPTESVKTAEKGKLRNKKKKKSSKQDTENSSALVPNPLLNDSEY